MRITLIPTAILAISTGQAPTLADPVAAQPASIPQASQEDWQEDLDLQRWSSSTFHPDHVANVQALSEAHGDEQMAVLLNAAELRLAHMLLFEATSILDGLDPAQPTHKRRHQILSAAAQLLAGKALEDPASAALLTSPRPDRAFWQTLQAIADGDAALLTTNVRDGFNGLGLQSRAVLRAMLPVFTEAAIETGFDRHAAAGLRLMDELPDLATAPTGHFLRGLAAERIGNESTALAAYFEAAKGWDQYAARARLAVADMSLRNGSRGALLAAQSTLKEGEEAWRGGHYELELLSRLASLYSGTENYVESLLTLGKLLARFPATPEARTAQVQAQELLSRIYTKGSEGKYPLATWMQTHLQLMPFYRYSPGFVRNTETFADYLLDLGSTDLAAQEYRRALALLEEQDNGSDMIAQDRFRLNLSLARAQHRAGLAQDARLTLELMDLVPGTLNAEAHRGLMAAVLADLGDAPALLETKVMAPTAAHLRDLGMTLAQQERWAQSSDVFRKFWRKFPDAFTVQDATRLLIAAKRSGDSATVDRVTDAFPGLTPSKPLVELAKSLSASVPALTPLRADTAAARLDRLEDAFNTIKDSGISP